MKSNKNDFIDAEAIAEAVLDPPFVSFRKKRGALDLQALHRVRDRWIQRKVALTTKFADCFLHAGLLAGLYPHAGGSDVGRAGYQRLVDFGER